MLLEQIVEHKKTEVEKIKKARPLNAVVEKIAETKPAKAFRLNMDSDGEVTIIAEIKRTSPLKGLLRADFNPRELAEAYRKGGAKAISVVTEQDFFQGSSDYIAVAGQASGLPVLRKDFIFSDYQVYESRVLGADAILLIAAILEDEDLISLVNLAGSLGMEALIEVHDRIELKRALKAEAGLIGINNRNLKTFQVDLATTLDLAAAIPPGVFVVSESGIASREDIIRLKQAGVKAALIGETLVRADDPCRKLKELLGE